MWLRRLGTGSWTGSCKTTALYTWVYSCVVREEGVEQPQLTSGQSLRLKALESYVETGRMVCPFCERRFSRRLKDFLRHLLRCEEGEAGQ